MPKNLPILFTNHLYTLALAIKRKRTYLYMQFKTPSFTTGDNYNVLYFLEEKLPSIFLSTCYNDRKLPFKQEVKNTELGHLYEHVLLEYIALLHFAKTGTGRDFVGNTTWDWRKNDRGSFQISLNVGKDDENTLSEALTLANRLMEILLQPQTPISEHQHPVLQLQLLDTSKNI